jgi:hypothetical protein
MGILGHLKLLDRVRVPAPGPGQVNASIREAALAINAGVPRAACVMLRRAVERWCEEQGGTGNLAERISALQRQNLITPVAAAGLHAIRFLGNDAAHLNSRHFDSITIDDAVEAYALVERMLQTALRRQA